MKYTMIFAITVAVILHQFCMSECQQVGEKQWDEDPDPAGHHQDDHVIGTSKIKTVKTFTARSVSLSFQANLEHQDHDHDHSGQIHEDHKVGTNKTKKLSVRSVSPKLQTWLYRYDHDHYPTNCNHSSHDLENRNHSLYDHSGNKHSDHRQDHSDLGHDHPEDNHDGQKVGTNKTKKVSTHSVSPGFQTRPKKWCIRCPRVR